MSLVLEGKLANVFTTPKGVDKNGKEYGGEVKIQVLYQNTLANGEKRAEMATLAVSDATPYEGKESTSVRIPVAVSVYQNKLFMKAMV